MYGPHPTGEVGTFVANSGLTRSGGRMTVGNEKKVIGTVHSTQKGPNHDSGREGEKKDSVLDLYFSLTIDFEKTIDVLFCEDLSDRPPFAQTIKS